MSALALSVIATAILPLPSGHAMHVGAVASAVSCAYPKCTPITRGIGLVVAATRIVLLALDDGCPCRPGDGGPGGAVSASAVQKKKRGSVCRTLFGLTDGLGSRNSKNATAPRS